MCSFFTADISTLWKQAVESNKMKLAVQLDVHDSTAN